MPTKAPPKEQLRNDLLQVIEGTLTPVFHFQPIADLRGATVAGYEALVRLPVTGHQNPEVCLQAAAENGFQLELEAVLVREALAARQLLPGNAFLSINVSPAFLCSPFWQQLQARENSLAGVVIEITEGECIHDYRDVRRCAEHVCSRGGMVAIDDAGAGYASLKHILELKPSFIKLDRALIANCDTDRAKSTLIQMLGDAADRMNAWVITEGVETAQELAELIRLEVPLAQGYFLGRPQVTMSALTYQAEQVIQMLAPHRVDGDDLLLYGQDCPTASSRAEAEARLARQGGLVAVIDGWRRPVELLERRPPERTRVLPGFLRCHTSCSLREALRRALTREEPCRFDPILLTNDDGSLQAVVALDRLMLAALEDR